MFTREEARARWAQPSPAVRAKLERWDVSLEDDPDAYYEKQLTLWKGSLQAFDSGLDFWEAVVRDEQALDPIPPNSDWALFLPLSEEGFRLHIRQYRTVSPAVAEMLGEQIVGEWGEYLAGIYISCGSRRLVLAQHENGYIGIREESTRNARMEQSSDSEQKQGEEEPTKSQESWIQRMLSWLGTCLCFLALPFFLLYIAYISVDEWFWRIKYSRRGEGMRADKRADLAEFRSYVAACRELAPLPSVSSLSDWEQQQAAVICMYLTGRVGPEAGPTLQPRLFLSSLPGLAAADEFVQAGSDLLCLFPEEYEGTKALGYYYPTLHYQFRKVNQTSTYPLSDWPRWKKEYDLDSDNEYWAFEWGGMSLPLCGGGGSQLWKREGDRLLLVVEGADSWIS